MKKLLTIVVCFLALTVVGQNKVYKEAYTKGKSGFYTLKSINFKVEGEVPIIQPQVTIDSITTSTGYLVLQDEDVILFKNSNPKTIDDVGGILQTNSLLNVESIEYRAMYTDTAADKITFEVWCTITLNGQTYYTDLRIHQVAFTHPLPAHKQLFTIFFQQTGYDNFYDKGYPGHFHVLAFDVVSDGYQLVYNSQMDFNYDNQFWVQEDVKTKMTAKGLEFEITGWDKEDYKAVWNGKELVDVVVTKHSSK